MGKYPRYLRSANKSKLLYATANELLWCKGTCMRLRRAYHSVCSLCRSKNISRFGPDIGGFSKFRLKLIAQKIITISMSYRVLLLIDVLMSCKYIYLIIHDRFILVVLRVIHVHQCFSCFTDSFFDFSKMSDTFTVIFITNMVKRNVLEFLRNGFVPHEFTFLTIC